MLSELPKAQISDYISMKWGSTRMVAKGRIHELEQLPGVAVIDEGQIAGMVTYHIEGDACELVTINSSVRQAGIGARLLNEVERLALGLGCSRIWCITTNDNSRAIRFFQKNGMTLCGFYRNAAEESRKLKPQIPLTGQDGIPIEHELEFEKQLIN